MTFGTQTKGVYAIAPTPFLPDGALDEASVARMTAFYGAAGVDGLTILGIMGEAPKLEPEESMAVVRGVLAEAGGLPVVVGVSAPGFAAMRRVARESMAAGVAGVMIAPPSSLRWRPSAPTFPSCCRITRRPPTSSCPPPSCDASSKRTPPA